jgi:hypothetical protein
MKKLTLEEFVVERRKINDQLKQLREKYIADNTEIRPGVLVRVEDRYTCLLKGYTLVADRIYPILFVASKTGKPTTTRVHVSFNAKMEVINKQE